MLFFDVGLKTNNFDVYKLIKIDSKRRAAKSIKI